MARKNTTTVTAPVAVEAEVKRGPGRPRKYHTPEAIAQAKRDAVKRYNENKVKRNQEVAALITSAVTTIDLSRLNKNQQAAILSVADLVAALKF